MLGKMVNISYVRDYPTKLFVLSTFIAIAFQNVPITYSKMFLKWPCACRGCLLSSTKGYVSLYKIKP